MAETTNTLGAKHVNDPTATTLELSTAAVTDETIAAAYEARLGVTAETVGVMSAKTTSK